MPQPLELAAQAMSCDTSAQAPPRLVPFRLGALGEVPGQCPCSMGKRGGEDEVPIDSDEFSAFMTEDWGVPLGISMDNP